MGGARSPLWTVHILSQGYMSQVHGRCSEKLWKKTSDFGLVTTRGVETIADFLGSAFAYREERTSDVREFPKFGETWVGEGARRVVLVQFSL